MLHFIGRQLNGGNSKIVVFLS